MNLTHVASGRAHHLDPDRTLIGSAGHADIHLPADRPRLAAVVTRLPAGWCLYPLCDTPPVRVLGRAVAVGRRVMLADELTIEAGGEAFRFDGPAFPTDSTPPVPRTSPVCRVTVTGSDGAAREATVDRTLLVGRLPACDLSYPAETKLSRLNLLIAQDSGEWYALNLSDNPFGRNRARVDKRAELSNGDDLRVGPLRIGVQILAGQKSGQVPPPPPRPPAPLRPPAAPPPMEETPARAAGPPAAPPAAPAAPHPPPVEETPARAAAPPPVVAAAAAEFAALHAEGTDLAEWLDARPVGAGPADTGGDPREFWADALETTTARALRVNSQYGAAFRTLAGALRAGREAPSILREFYFLYKAAGLPDLCFRALRRIEAAAEARGRADPWVLEGLARACEDLGAQHRPMFDQAVAYWGRLEAATGTSYAREQAAVAARRFQADFEYYPAGAAGADV